MTTILAAIDNSAAARPVLATARALGVLFASDVEALHVREDGDRTATAAARAARIPLVEVRDQTIESLLHAARRGEVAVLVLGARGFPLGSRPTGHVALEVMTTLRKPLVVVPPEVSQDLRLRRALVPLDGTRVTAAALTRVLELAGCDDLEVIVLHVHDAESVPPFSDQLQHEIDAWRREFAARYCDGLTRVERLEVRVGVPGESVLEVAAEAEADLIALGWSQDLSAGRAAVVREVLAHSSVPVLLVPLEATA